LDTIVFSFGAFCYASVHLNFCLEQIVASHLLKYSRLNIILLIELINHIAIFKRAKNGSK